jgi:hypothetical protein
MYEPRMITTIAGGGDAHGLACATWSLAWKRRGQGETGKGDMEEVGRTPEGRTGHNDAFWAEELVHTRRGEVGELELTCAERTQAQRDSRTYLPLRPRILLMVHMARTRRPIWS